MYSLDQKAVEYLFYHQKLSSFPASEFLGNHSRKFYLLNRSAQCKKKYCPSSSILWQKILLLLEMLIKPYHKVFFFFLPFYNVIKQKATSRPRFFSMSRHQHRNRSQTSAFKPHWGTARPLAPQHCPYITFKGLSSRCMLVNTANLAKYTGHCH